MIAQADAVKIPLADKSVHCCMTSPPYWGLRKYAGEQGEEPLGLEPTPERHVERMVEVFREVRRVLRDDGVVWLNYGDCYYNHRPGAGSALPSQTLAGGISGKGGDKREQPDFVPRRANKQEIGSGSLMMMPHRVALALQADGWIVRQDLVWYKRNPMPESVNGWRWQRETVKKTALDVAALGGYLKQRREERGISRSDLVPRFIDRYKNAESVKAQLSNWELGKNVPNRTDYTVLKQILAMSDRFDNAIRSYWVSEEKYRHDTKTWAVEDADNSGEQTSRERNLWTPDPEGDLELKRGSWRHTRAHEYVFMLTKKMQYWSNQEAVREDAPDNKNKHYRAGTYISQMQSGLVWEKNEAPSSGRNPRSVLDDPSDSVQLFIDWMRSNHGLDLDELLDQFHYEATNPGSTLDVPTAPYKGAHYATFPPNLIAPLIRATCPRWACPVCGQGWAAVVERSEEYMNELARPNSRALPFKEFGEYLKKRRLAKGFSKADIDKKLETNSTYAWWEGRIWYGKLAHHAPLWKFYEPLKQILGLDDRYDRFLKNQETSWGQSSDKFINPSAGKHLDGPINSILGYRPTCEHPHTQEEAVPGIVFDPFLGSGTTVKVAQDLLRKGIGIDISMEYLDLQAKVRIGQGSPSNVLDDLPLFQ